MGDEPVPKPVDEEEAAQVAAARAVFEANVRAIQERDREGYLGTYLKTDKLVRSGPVGFELGWDGLAEGAPATGSDDWPASLVARDLQLTWLRDGLVYGTYRYRVSFDGTAWVQGLSERLFVQTADGWRIAVTSAFEGPQGTPASPLALVGATVHSGDGAPPIKDAVVITRGGVIESVGTRAEVDLPAGLEVVDVSGRHLIPGLIDTHVHYSQTGWVDGRPDALNVQEDYPYAEAMATNEAHPERFHRAFLASGVTAVFDVGGYPWTRRLPAETEASAEAPHVVAAGPLIATMDPGLNLVDRRQLILPTTEEEARKMVRSHAASGSGAIKFWFVARSPEEIEKNTPLLLATGDEAKKVGLPLVVHATELAAARVAIAAGAKLLVHSVENEFVDAAFVQSCVESGVSLCPTLTVFGGYSQVFLRELSEEVKSQLPLVHPTVRDRVLATLEVPFRGSLKRMRASLEARAGFREKMMFANLVSLHEAGVPIVLGTDAGNPLTLHGPSVFPELEAMQAAGLTPSEVLVAATSNAAAALGRENDLGRVAPGFVADLVILERDPTVTAANLRSITHTMRAGTLWKKAELLAR